MMSSQSLLHKVKKEMEFKVHYIREGMVYTAVLVDDTLTLREAIIEALTKFNLEQQLALPEDESLY